MTTHDVVIGQGGGQAITAELVQPKDPQRALGRGIVYVHGGGWAGGSAMGEMGRSYVFAKHGYFVASINYRLSGAAKWPAQIEDCKLGVRWLRANAAKYGIDPDKIGAAGHSAGGHLVACLGTLDDPKWEGTGGCDGVSSKVQAVLDTSGPIDFTDGHFYEGSDYIPQKNWTRTDGMLLALFGMPFATNSEVWKDASPITHVQAGDPPFLIVCGEKDDTVSPAQGTRFAAALQAAGVPTELIVVKNGGHSLGPIPGETTTDPTGQQLQEREVAFFGQYLK
jgi:acetyl esterase/lipase